MLPRVVATDLDGTLLDVDGTVAPRTCRALEAIQATGAEVVVCTARPVRWMREIAQAGGISGAAVCANGAVVWDLSRDCLIESFPIAPPAAREVVVRLTALMPGAVYAVEGIDSFGHEPGYDIRWPLPDDVLVDHVDALLSRPPVKLIMYRPPGDTASSTASPAEARAAVAGLVELTWSEPAAAFLEISAVGVSKASGLAALCAARGVSAAEVIAFGDMPNDLPMLAWAGRSYAMGNAAPEVAAAAHEVTLSNAEHGVAVVLERLLAEAR